MERYHVRFDPTVDGELFAALRRVGGPRGMNAAILETLRLGLPLYRQAVKSRVEQPAGQPHAPPPPRPSLPPAAQAAVVAQTSGGDDASPTATRSGSSEPRVSSPTALSEATRSLLNQYD